MHRIALVTCDELPRPDTDLPILVAAFARAGAEAAVVEWTDASVDWGAFDAALIRSTWDYVARFEAFTAWLEATAARTRLLNPRPLVGWNLHKGYLVELAREGVAVVPTGLVRAGDDPDWPAYFERFGDLVVKPAISAGSFATIRVAAGDLGAVRAHHLEHAARDLLVQPCLASVVAHGESNLVHFGGRFSHAIHKGARWAGDREQSRGLVEPTAAEHALAREALAAVAARGLGEPVYARVDMAEGPDGRPLLMELELVEPALFLDRAPDRAVRLVEVVLRAIGGLGAGGSSARGASSGSAAVQSPHAPG